MTVVSTPFTNLCLDGGVLLDDFTLILVLEAEGPILNDLGLLLLFGFGLHYLLESNYQLMSNINQRVSISA